MRIKLTKQLDYWLEGCSSAVVQPTALPRLLNTHDPAVIHSYVLKDGRLGPGTAAALIEYQYKRQEPVIVSVRNARLACVSLPMANGELEEHYYFVNERNEWLTENPFVAAFQYWFKDVIPMTRRYGDYEVSPTFAVQAEQVPLPDGSRPIFLGGRMNWTHWNIDCLPPLLLIQPVQDAVLLTSRLNAWQLDALHFFGFEDYRRLQISNARGIQIYEFDSLQFVWNFDQIDRLHYLRSMIMKRKPTNHVEPFLLTAPDFNAAERVQRVSNPNELAEEVMRAGAISMKQSKLSYQEKLTHYSQIRLSVCLPGSESINPFLFGHSSIRVIQLVPWPNDLSVLSTYSMVVCYRQVAGQLFQNINYLYSDSDDVPQDFDLPRYFSPVKLRNALQGFAS